MQDPLSGRRESNMGNRLAYAEPMRRTGQMEATAFSNPAKKTKLMAKFQGGKPECMSGLQASSLHPKNSGLAAEGNPVQASKRPTGIEIPISRPTMIDPRLANDQAKRSVRAAEMHAHSSDSKASSMIAVNIVPEPSKSKAGIQTTVSNRTELETIVTKDQPRKTNHLDWAHPMSKPSGNTKYQTGKTISPWIPAPKSNHGMPDAGIGKNLSGGRISSDHGQISTLFLTKSNERIAKSPTKKSINITEIQDFTPISSKSAKAKGESQTETPIDLSHEQVPTSKRIMFKPGTKNNQVGGVNLPSGIQTLTSIETTSCTGTKKSQIDMSAGTAWIQASSLTPKTSATGLSNDLVGMLFNTTRMQNIASNPTVSDGGKERDRPRGSNFPARLHSTTLNQERSSKGTLQDNLRTTMNRYWMYAPISTFEEPEAGPGADKRGRSKIPTWTQVPTSLPIEVCIDNEKNQAKKSQRTQFIQDPRSAWAKSDAWMAEDQVGANISTYLKKAPTSSRTWFHIGAEMDRRGIPNFATTHMSGERTAKDKVGMTRSNLGPGRYRPEGENYPACPENPFSNPGNSDGGTTKGQVGTSRSMECTQFSTSTITSTKNKFERSNIPVWVQASTLDRANSSSRSTTALAGASLKTVLIQGPTSLSKQLDMRPAKNQPGNRHSQCRVQTPKSSPPNLDAETSRDQTVRMTRSYLMETPISKLTRSESVITEVQSREANLPACVATTLSMPTIVSTGTTEDHLGKSNFPGAVPSLNTTNTNIEPRRGPSANTFSSHLEAPTSQQRNSTTLVRITSNRAMLDKGTKQIHSEKLNSAVKEQAHSLAPTALVKNNSKVQGGNSISASKIQDSPLNSTEPGRDTSRDNAGASRIASGMQVFPLNRTKLDTGSSTDKTRKAMPKAWFEYLPSGPSKQGSKNGKDRARTTRNKEVALGTPPKIVGVEAEKSISSEIDPRGKTPDAQLASANNRRGMFADKEEIGHLPNLLRPLQKPPRTNPSTKIGYHKKTSHGNPKIRRDQGLLLQRIIIPQQAARDEVVKAKCRWVRDCQKLGEVFNLRGEELTVDFSQHACSPQPTIPVCTLPFVLQPMPERGQEHLSTASALVSAGPSNLQLRPNGSLASEVTEATGPSETERDTLSIEPRKRKRPQRSWSRREKKRQRKAAALKSEQTEGSILPSAGV